MSDNNLVEQLEFGQAFLAELQSGGADYQALIAFLKENDVCDFSSFGEIITDPRVRAAAAFLREKSTASQYRRRLTARAYLNQDNLTSGRTAFWIDGLPPTSSIPTSARALAFPLLTGDHEDLFTTDSSLNTAFTIKTAGAYKLSFNGLLAGYPHAVEGTSIVSPTTTSHRFNAVAGAPASAPVDIVLRVETQSQTTYTTLASILLYGTDFVRWRTRFIGGAATLRLHVNSKVSLHIQRRATMGQYVDNTTSQVSNEAVGFSKLINAIPGTGNPTRDNHNYFEITRLT